MTERTTVSRAFGQDTCDVTIETGATSARTVQFQDCNYQPQCYIEAQKLVFNQHGATFSEIVSPEKECLKQNTTGPLPCSCHFDRQRGDCVCSCA